LRVWYKIKIRWEFTKLLTKILKIFRNFKVLLQRCYS
jgi:hypothetical protein